MSNRLLLLSLLLLLPSTVFAQKFTLQKIVTEQPGPTLLVIGGIHGDEPGGFNAAALLMTRYRLQNGSLWIIPDLNGTSILRRAHGWYGDMNYKFNGLKKTDLDYRQVQRVKQLIRDPQVDLVLNLHDGSGYYRPQHQARDKTPQRWGQSCVIDQATLPGVRFGNLEQLSQQAIKQINQQLLQPSHRFHLKNTHTASSDAVMRKALTYFALRNRKPAIGLEASKQLPTHQRVYYLLVAIEAYLQQVGIKFSRDFPLTPKAVKQALTKDIQVAFAEGQIKLTLTTLRPQLKHFPLEKDRPLSYQADNPLVKIRPDGNRHRIHFGNNRLTLLQPEYVEYDRSLKFIEMQIDGQQTKVDFGEQVMVQDSFQISPIDGYRVNVIGYRHPQKKNEAGQEIDREQFDSNYSIDNNGRIYRIEVYRHDKFCGMVLVDFAPAKGKEPLATQATLSISDSTANN